MQMLAALALHREPRRFSCCDSCKTGPQHGPQPQGNRHVFPSFVRGRRSGQRPDCAPHAIRPKMSWFVSAAEIPLPCQLLQRWLLPRIRMLLRCAHLPAEPAAQQLKEPPTCWECAAWVPLGRRCPDCLCPRRARPGAPASWRGRCAAAGCLQEAMGGHMEFDLI